MMSTAMSSAPVFTNRPSSEIDMNDTCGDDSSFINDNTPEDISNLDAQNISPYKLAQFISQCSKCKEHASSKIYLCGHIVCDQCCKLKGGKCAKCPSSGDAVLVTNHPGNNFLRNDCSLDGIDRTWFMNDSVLCRSHNQSLDYFCDHCDIPMCESCADTVHRSHPFRQITPKLVDKELTHFGTVQSMLATEVKKRKLLQILTNENKDKLDNQWCNFIINLKQCRERYLEAIDNRIQELQAEGSQFIIHEKSKLEKTGSTINEDLARMARFQMLFQAGVRFSSEMQQFDMNGALCRSVEDVMGKKYPDLSRTSVLDYTPPQSVLSHVSNLMGTLNTTPSSSQVSQTNAICVSHTDGSMESNGVQDNLPTFCDTPPTGLPIKSHSAYEGGMSQHRDFSAFGAERTFLGDLGNLHSSSVWSSAARAWKQDLCASMQTKDVKENNPPRNSLEISNSMPNIDTIVEPQWVSALVTPESTAVVHTPMSPVPRQSIGASSIVSSMSCNNTYNDEEEVHPIDQRLRGMDIGQPLMELPLPPTALNQVMVAPGASSQASAVAAVMAANQQVSQLNDISSAALLASTPHGIDAMLLASLRIHSGLSSAAAAAATPGVLTPRCKMQYHTKFGEFGVTEGQFTEPSGVAVNAHNEIIVADTNNHRIQVFSHNGVFKYQFGENGRRGGQFMYPNRVAVSKRTGDIVVTERSPTHQVQVYSANGQFIRKFGNQILQHPRGVCVDKDGRIIVVECKVMRVVIFDQMGNILHQFKCTRLQFPNSIAVDDNYRIYISDNRAHCIRVFNYRGDYLGQIGHQGLTNYPIGVAVRNDGHILVADNHNNFNVTVFTPHGVLVQALESKVKHAQCFDIDILDDGSIVLASKDYRIYVYKYVSNALDQA